ncbi:MAG: Matrixin [Pseudomonadota bacterium]
MYSKFALGTMVAGSLLMATNANAFVLLGKTPRRLGASPETPQVEFHWNGSTPGLKEKKELFDGEFTDLDDADYLEKLIQLAMDQWNNVHGSFLRLVLVKDPLVSSNPEDRIHSISVDEDVSLTAGAFATPNWEVDNQTSNTIEDCDIHLKKGSTDVNYLLATLVHELGHCVGLGHNHTNYKSIMGYSRSGNSYKLGADDKAGAVWLYPDPAVSDETPEELIACGVMTQSQPAQGNPAGRGWQIAFLMLLPLAFAGLVAAVGRHLQSRAVRHGARGRN